MTVGSRKISVYVLVNCDALTFPPLQNVVTRVTSLPLVSSAYEMCTSLYNYAKETHPYVTTACNIAEMVAAVAVGSAVGGAQPILNQLEPQSKYKNRGNMGWWWKHLEYQSSELLPQM